MDVRADGLACFRTAPSRDRVPSGGAVGRPAVAGRSGPRRERQRHGRAEHLEHAVKTGARKVIYAASGGTIYGEPKRVPAKETTARGRRPTSRTASRRRSCSTTWYFQRYRGLNSRRSRSATCTGRARIRRRGGVDPIFAAKMLAGETPTISATATRRATTCSSTTRCTRSSRRWKRIGQARQHRDRAGDEREPHLQTARRHHRLHRGARSTGQSAGELRRIALDISSAPNAIGWKPWTHLEDGLAETVAFLKGV